MEAQAYLLKEKLFTFNLPNYDADQWKYIKLNHVFEESCIYPMDQFEDTDILLTTKLKEAISDKSQSNREFQIKLFGCVNQEKGYFSADVNSCIFRDIFIMLGDQMRLRLEIGNPQVEVASNKKSESKVAEMAPRPVRGQISYSSGSWDMPARWLLYWNTCLNIKFSANISLIICGTVVLPKSLQEGCFEIENIRESIPKKLLEEKIETDMAIILNNGIHVDCHKIFLQAQSSVFRSMMQKGKFLEGEANQVKMDDMSENAVNALLAFLYYWGLEEPLGDPQVAVELLQASHKYDIKSLETSMKSILLTKPVEWFDIPTTIKLFFFSRNVEEVSQLKTKSLLILKLKKNDLVNSEEFKAMFEDDEKRSQGFELCSALLQAI